MGGFAAEHHNAILKLEMEGECRLVCTCDPKIGTFSDRWEDLRFDMRMVKLFNNLRDMLTTCGRDLDLVTIPTPVPLHASMHQACCERGLAVYLEKPPTLDPRELQTMLRAEQQARKLTNVGFNFIIEPHRQMLKQHLVSGRFGAVKEVRVFARWPRGSNYYTRNDWAGKLMLGNQLVLDSCLGNAMAHLVQNGLYWAEAHALDDFGEVTDAQAELYRIHPIQGTDTVFLTAQIADGPVLRVAMTHACMGEAREYEEVICEGATITTKTGSDAENGHYRDFLVTFPDGKTKNARQQNYHHLTENLRAYLQYVRGERERPVTRLVDSRPFVNLNGLAYLAAQHITAVTGDHVQWGQAPGPLNGKVAQLQGFDAIAERFLFSGAFPSQQDAPWAIPGGRATLTDLPQLPEVVARMVG
jgi:predicted dehydrogenase